MIVVNYPSSHNVVFRQCNIFTMFEDKKATFNKLRQEWTDIRSDPNSLVNGYPVQLISIMCLQ